MSGQLLSYTSRQAWDDEMTRTHQMFFEADRLDAIAYKIIGTYQGDAHTWARFIEAKKIADAQRTAAYQEWMRINRAKRK